MRPPKERNVESLWGTHANLQGVRRGLQPGGSPQQERRLVVAFESLATIIRTLSVFKWFVLMNDKV